MIIYKITNLINSKIYIGQTIGSIQQRWRKHCKKSSVGCSAIRNAISKYGKENFIIEQIDNASTIEELNIKEKYWIKTIQSISPLGYNLRSGGDNGLHNQETLEKQSIAKLGIKNPMYKKGSHLFMTQEAILEKNKNISLAKKGVKNPKSAAAIRGRTKETHEYLARMAEKKNIQNLGENNPNAKQITVNGILYKTMKDAVKNTDLSMYKLRKIMKEEN